MLSRSCFALLVLTSCSLSPTAVPCDDGKLCADGTRCVAVMVNEGSAAPTSQDFCVSQAQLDACPNGDDQPCMVANTTTPGTCHGGACFANACGNGLVDVNEVCDDGNLANGDHCRQDCLSNETCGNRQVDHAQGETCDDGNLVAHDGCTSTCQVEIPAWQILRQPSTWGPDALAYDANRGRVVALCPPPNAPEFGASETQEWDGHRIHRVQTVLGPLYPVEGALAYDAADHELVLFGGYSNDDETWSYAADGWHLRSTPATPPGRGGNGMTYDGKRQRILMFGGENGSATQDTEVWAWQHGTWTVVPTPTSPRPAFRSSFAFVYDSARDVVLLVGGTQHTGSSFNDVWELSFDASGAGTWVNKTPSSNPFATGRFTGAYAPKLAKVIAMPSSGTPTTYAWNGTAWGAVATPPGGATNASLTTDVDRGRIVMYGAKSDGAGGSIAVVTEFDPSTNVWTSPYTFGASPIDRDSSSTSTDPRRHQLVRFGGAPIAPGSALGDTWVWDGVWRVAPNTPTPPSARFNHRTVYDPVHDEIVMFGGIKSSGATNETWVWRHTNAADFGHWEQRFPTTNPPARFGHMMAWDGRSNRVLLYGGRAAVGFTFLDDTYAWDGTNWTALDVPRSSSSPPATQLSGMAYDVDHGTIVLFDQETRTTWLWDGSAWSAPATPPVDRPTSVPVAMAWDPTRHHLVLEALASIWTWDAGATNWVRAEVPDAPVGENQTIPELATDPDGAGVVSLGSPADTTYAGELARLRDDAAVREPEETCVATDVDGNGAAGCADVNCWTTCRPLCAPDDPSAACAAAPSAASPGCGDGVCDPILESCLSCPADCNACPAFCGNQRCDTGETAATCPGDCP